MSSQFYSTHMIQQSPIFTHHIKTITPSSFNDSLFTPSDQSITLIEKSLCQIYHKPNLQNLSKSEHELLGPQQKNQQTIDIKETLTITQPQSSAAQQDAIKLYTQLIGKGKKVQALLKTISKDGSLTSSRGGPLMSSRGGSLTNSREVSLTNMKQQVQKLVQSNVYLKSVGELVLSEYYKKRKLGHKLRGLNMDLLNQIQTKLYPLIQTQILYYHAQNNNQSIDLKFKALLTDFKHQLNQAQLSPFQ